MARLPSDRWAHLLPLPLLALLIGSGLVVPMAAVEIRPPAQAANIAAATQIENFVTRFYQQCLGRDPDAAGLAYWSDSLGNGSLTGANVAFGFVFSPEFLARSTTNGEFTTILYRAFFDREPDAGGFAHWQAALAGGMLREDVLYGFLFAPEFANLCLSFGITQYAPADLQRSRVRSFVRRFYLTILLREPDAGGAQSWSQGLIGGSLTGATLADGFIGSAEFIGRGLSDSEFVTVMYRAFFDRDPDAGGQAAWLAQLAGGTTRLQVVGGFTHSQEFINLCRQYGILPFVWDGNQPPVLADGDAINLTMSEDAGPLEFVVSAADAEGQVLTWNIQRAAGHGQAQAAGEGSSKTVTYAPQANFSGNDDFVVRVADGFGGSDDLTVNVVVTPVNDAPTVASDTFLTNRDVDIPVTFRGTDVDGDLLTYTVVTQPIHGTLSAIDSSVPAFQFVMFYPEPGWSGTDSFTYQASDGSATSAVATLIVTAEVAPAPVFVTGQTISFEPGDDGDLRPGIAYPSPRFTDNSNGTILDEATRLIWLKNAGSSYNNWAGSLTFCQGLANGQAGLSDGSGAGSWRLPNVNELASLMDYGNGGSSGPMLPAGHPFTGTGQNYWSSTAHAFNPSVGKWITILPSGHVATFANPNAYTWPCRGGPSTLPRTGQTISQAAHDDGANQSGIAWPVWRFTDRGDGAVTDRLTGLVWLRDAYAFGRRTWPQALADCASLQSGQHGLMDASQPGDWRLPTVRELLSLVDFSRTNPPLSAGHPFLSVQLQVTGYPEYWTSTTLRYSTGNAFRVSMFSGTTSVYGKTTFNPVWPVRAGTVNGQPAALGKRLDSGAEPSLRLARTTGSGD